MIRNKKDKILKHIGKWVLSVGRRNKNSVLIIPAVLIIILGSMFIFAQNEVNVILNGKKINFPDAKPCMDTQAGRVLVPVRFVAENLGASVEWDPVDKQVGIIRGQTNIEFKPGEETFKLNDVEKSMDTIVFIKEDRTYVPLRVIGESLGMDIEWNGKTHTVLLEDKNKNENKDKSEDSNKDRNNREFTVQGVGLGQSEDELISNLGEPNRKDLSEYGFYWYIYKNDYSKYIQVGVEDGIVVGLYTNADNWRSAGGISIGMARADAEKLLGEPLEAVLKDNVNYLISGADEKGVYIVDGSYVTIFYDIHNNNTVTALQIIGQNTELSLKKRYGNYSRELRDGFERQVFDLANSVRVREGLEPFVWSDKARNSSRKHSEDMAYNNFFSHTNLKGQNPFDRMLRGDIAYMSAAENIAAGPVNAIQVHEGWMNSYGHRINILGECKALGVGVAHNPDSKYKYYYTQNFFTGR